MDLARSETQLRHALVVSRRDYSPGTASVVRDLICEFVDAAKAAGLSADRIIVEVQRIAANAGWRRRLFLRTGAAIEDVDAETLLKDITALCIERYFKSRPSNQPSSNA
jgi:hypothetical protein